MSDERPRYWFRAKRYGWGWGFPARWQGWVVFTVFALLVALVGLLLKPEERPLEFTVALATLVVLLLLVCWWKGEPPRWRWGGD